MNRSCNDIFAGDILLVDDTPDNLRLLSTMLTKQGFKVRKVLNGQRAIDSVQAELPDLILLDIKMPEMDGYEVCQRLKNDPATKAVPIIFISVLDNSVEKVKAFAVGGADYITKPFQEAEVLARIEHQLRIQRLQKQLMNQNQQLARSNEELEQLQKQLIKQNEELARSNWELEQFAYVVSHDLQQPLQSVTGFVKLFLAKYGQMLDETARNYLDLIHDSGRRMQRFIQDILTYAQAGKQNQELNEIDCNLVLEQVVENLQMLITEKQVTLMHDTLPTIMGNETQLIQLFQNLIGNAIKFVRPNVLPQIRISVIQHNQEWLFGVHDNGIGIAPQYLERIFEVFQRLHTVKTYNGTGIGLATCKKIIENHQGRIWAESQPGQGTTFYFTLRIAN